MAAARGIVRLTGLFTESGVTVDNPCGIKLINGQQPFPVRAVTANATVRVIDATSGNITITLISAVATRNRYVVKKVDATANTVTVAAAGVQTIDGAAAKVLTTQWETVTVIPSGGNWLTV
ncbi:hypothetical protein ACIQV3_08390 [Streptomyces sp. NPDC099050]|uniref:hypothetical protein n=1 Tax=Streptomyces sp. NPDC099050 TaxID=3366100 RepID=UPI00381997DE